MHAHKIYIHSVMKIETFSLSFFFMFQENVNLNNLYIYIRMSIVYIYKHIHICICIYVYINRYTYVLMEIEDLCFVSMSVWFCNTHCNPHCVCCSGMPASNMLCSECVFQGSLLNICVGTVWVCIAQTSSGDFGPHQNNWRQN